MKRKEVAAVPIHLKQNGFALTELIVVVVIMVTLLSIATLSFNSMQRKANTERQTREFFSDLNAARSDSIFRKNRHSIVINSAANGYAFRRYSSENEDREDGGTVISTKTISQTLSKVGGGSAADIIFQFDTRGFAATPGDRDTIRIDPVGSGAAFDCVVIAESRTNLGRMEGGSCVQR